MSDSITHPELVTLLVKPPENILTQLNIYSVDLWHGATGVAGETGELLEAVIAAGELLEAESFDNTHIAEELGDLYFYMEQICQRAPLILDWDEIATFARNQELTPDRMLLYGAQIAILGSGVLDSIKKVALYNRPLDAALLKTQMTELGRWSMVLGYMFGLDRAVCLRGNIAKLSKRYEELRYTDRAAQLRLDKAPERKPFRGDADLEPHTAERDEATRAHTPGVTQEHKRAD